LDLDYKALKVATLLDKLDAAGCHLSLVLLDACRESVLPARSVGGASRGLGRGLAKIEAPTGTLISFACAPGKLASDGEGRNGVYTEQLLQHLPKSEDIEFVMRYVVHGVETATNGKQVPFRDSSLKAKPGIYLIEPPKVAEAAPAAPRTSSMTALDEAADAGADVAGLTEWLARIGLAKHENSVIPKLVTAGVLNVEELEELEEGDVADLGLPKFEQQKLANALKALAAERKAKAEAERKGKETADRAEAERIKRERREKAEAERRVKEEAERKAKAAAETAEAARRAKAEEEARKQAPAVALSVKAQEYLKQMEGETMLHLISEQLGDAEAIAIAEALKVNKTLTKLDVDNNNIGAAGESALAEALKVNKTLTTLWVSYNNIGDAGASALRSSARSGCEVKGLPAA